MATRFACFIGWSDTGKTGFIVSCALALKRLGVKAAAIKCASHGASFNVGGKDSTRFFEAYGGAAVISDAETFVVRGTPREWDAEYAASLFPDAEAVLIEGAIVEGAVKVLVAGSADDASKLKRPLAEFDALVADAPALTEAARAADVAAFGSGDAETFVRAWLEGGPLRMI